jgi:hypothetical protein
MLSDYLASTSFARVPRCRDTAQQPEGRLLAHGRCRCRHHAPRPKNISTGSNLETAMSFLLHHDDFSRLHPQGLELEPTTQPASEPPVLELTAAPPLHSHPGSSAHARGRAEDFVLEL